MSKRDGFRSTIIEALAKRASYICSNPTCRSLTLYPSQEDRTKAIFLGVAAHITAASSNGPRYDQSLTSEQRSSLDNGIFLCELCATLIDKNRGADYSVEQLKTWKHEHETWVMN
ncbi:MAG: hypothetical protein GY943_13065, partial [Chloroflexi bacterium]|nr:hypothetical protein [Chloroflexota bacterium]